uniref:Uncharacterized protein n=1 Tax=Molossus molossus TaxID=27622 RepID=A0A7J8IZ45_MOLMO|nr:hypothetical protein HJG59_010269 [Molossus molossus]
MTVGLRRAMSTGPRSRRRSRECRRGFEGAARQRWHFSEASKGSLEGTQTSATEAGGTATFLGALPAGTEVHTAGSRSNVLDNLGRTQKSAHRGSILDVRWVLRVTVRKSPKHWCQVRTQHPLSFPSPMTSNSGASESTFSNLRGESRGLGPSKREERVFIPFPACRLLGIEGSCLAALREV